MKARCFKLKKRKAKRICFIAMRVLFLLFIIEDYFLFGVGEPYSLECSCGVVNRVMPLIVGGRRISFNKYPWLVLILIRNRYQCGGTLISSHYVLTAGHCVSTGVSAIHPNYFTIVLGAHNISNSKEHSRIYRRVEAIKLHEKFHGDEVHDVHDIALMKLNRKITYNRHVGPVCLPEFLDENVYKIPKGTVIGWGSENYYGQISDIPLETELDILSHEDCEKVTQADFKRHIIEAIGSMFCAYAYNHDACKGDSGGPFVIDNSQKQIVQIGIVSWGIKCAKKGIPGVYTKLTSYVNWIRKNTNSSTNSCYSQKLKYGE